MSEEEFPDYYHLLKVSPVATHEQIRRAYLDEVGFWYPDNFQGRAERYVRRATEITVRLNEAKEVLLNPEKRRVYDELYAEWQDLQRQPDSQTAETEQFDVIAFLDAQGLEVIDKRPQGGSLWVVGGRGLFDLMTEVRVRGLNFAFAKNGARSTRYRPAWYLKIHRQLRLPLFEQ